LHQPEVVIDNASEVEQLGSRLYGNEEVPMERVDGTNRCAHCGAILDIPAGQPLRLTIHAESGKPNVRVLSRDGTEIHRCEIAPLEQ
jgi:hypothetical protein